MLELIDKSKAYPAEEAIELVKKTANTHFDATIEAHVNLGLSAEKSEHQIRTSLTLPHPSPKASGGKPIKILVFTDKNKEEIKKLGAEIGTDENLKEIEKGKIDFVDSSGTRIAKLEEIDKIIADTSWMPKLAKVAKILGPKGLMPNPKAGTVTEDPVAAVKEFSGGRMELRMEKSPIIHITIGKASLDNQKLKENLAALINAIRSARPEGFKKELIKSVYLSSTMGPSVKVDPSTLQS
ncbi:MAG: 50S ribosomal protein L1 [Candidatus Woykebacteria bacterium GWB1_45_5]|uniref:Ribosomal protein n=2 Tax=Candidatus Woykeibacteriota TaxID=1817899 RepID=A0A1G1W1X4_9BACT|nr:MAG: 50S ribosomal protein L1 [Candidatus Woykebacteria bacterium GWA1_44_8]OGY24425.1 MAG: 50S ribosomal protein L1 [Candidatus Woykebacteria bacterium GWB1_45_5]